jgi:hypothetical protein
MKPEITCLRQKASSKFACLSGSRQTRRLLLIFARTDTRTWQRDVFPHADALLFIERRVHFYLPSGERGKSGTAPSVLLAYGQENVDALRNAGIAGAFFPKSAILLGTKGSTF